MQALMIQQSAPIKTEVPDPNLPMPIQALSTIMPANQTVPQSMIPQQAPIRWVPMEKTMIEKVGDKVVDTTAHLAVSGLASVFAAEQATAYAVESVGGGIIAEQLIGGPAGVVGGMIDVAL